MAEQAAQRAQRLLQVFGDVLPDATTDDRPDPLYDAGGSGDTGDFSEVRDRWLRDNRPPHHD